jgi:hypothetical protein
MADFKTALDITMGNEGAYNHGVGENETFFGIDRGFNPRWSGWVIVDKIKKDNPNLSDKQYDVLFKQNSFLMSDKDLFYKRQYWDTLMLDKINYQQVANILFDDNVNPCEISAARVMQEAAGVTIDGIVGMYTVVGVNSQDPEIYYNKVIAIRKAHYEDEVIKHPSQRAWLGSWLSRLKPYQK